MRGLFPILLVFLLTACGSKDNAAPPAKLKDIETELQTRRIWSEDSGSGSGKHFLRLQVFLDAETVYVTDNKGRVSAMDKNNGRERWSVATDQSVSAGTNGGQDKVLIGTLEGGLIALAAGDGEQIWQASLSSEVVNISRVESNRLVARTTDGTLSGINAENGEIVWQYNYTVPALSLRTTGTPMIEDGVVIAGLDDGHLVALALNDGKLLWNKTVASGRGRNEIDRMVDIDGAITIDNGVIYAASYQGRIAAVNLRDGRFIWVRDASSVEGVSANDNAVFYSDADGTLWALDKRSGATLWKQDALLNRQLSAPVSFARLLVVADLDGYLHWVSADDGRFLARDKTNDAASLLGTFSDEQRVYVFTDSGQLSAWRFQ